MPESRDVVVPVRRISPKQEQCFFGYYDLPAVDAVGRHLCHRVRFRDRLPAPGDLAELGWVTVPREAQAANEEPRFQPFAKTHAWKFQQGAMLQWLPSPTDTCLYNTFENGRFGSCVHNVRTGAQRRFPLPVANVSRDGRKALCINMARVYDFRPGYGYEETPDPFADMAAPENDGVYLLDLTTGGSRLILSLAEVVRFLEQSGEKIGGRKVVINHITINPCASRFLFLLRTFPVEGKWTTFLLTADAAGGGLRHHPVAGLASHYHWRDDDGMLFYANPATGGHPELVLISDRTSARQTIDPAFFLADGHCSYSPDKRWILYDSYPDTSTPDWLRTLQVYGLDRREGITLGRFRAEPYTSQTVDLRCDLHPRWMPDGLSITFDSIHEGFRGVYWAKLRDLMANRTTASP